MSEPQPNSPSPAENLTQPCRILLTGGAGFIGANLLRYLLANTPHEILNLDALTYAGNPRSLDDLDRYPRYHFAKTDICDSDALRRHFADFAPDWILHLAAESHVDRSIDAPSVFVRTNVLGTFTLLQAARAHFDTLSGPARSRFRFLHVSTDEVFGSLAPSAPRFSEATPYSPHSPYSASKAAADHFVRAWGDTFGLPVLVTNCSNNYGPYQFPEKLIPVVILKALHGDPIPVYGSGQNIRDWLHVEDHARALLAVISSGCIGETYTIGGDNERTNLDLVRLLCALLDELRPRADARPYADQITFVTDRPGHDLRYAIDATKIRRELGWCPLHDPISGFRHTVLWYLNNEAWWRPLLDGSYRFERLGLSAV